MATQSLPRENAISELSQLLGDRLTTSAAVRDQHANGECGVYTPQPPDAVAFPHSTEEVSAIVSICAAHAVPMVPYGVGTSVEGNVTAPYGGVCIDLSQMNEVVCVNEADLDCTVQAGVTRKQLNQYLKDTGLFFPIDPGADATLGGMAATRASGTNAVRYGTLRENVLGLTVVLPDGKIIKTGGRARKSAAGYDLTRLMVGSEGTLGVITEVTLRLYGIPEAISAAMCSFPTLEGAVNTVMLTIQSGIPVARMELLDDVQMDACMRYSKLDYAPDHTLLFEFHGTERGVEEQAQMVGEIAADYGGSDFRWTTTTEERNALWQSRHDVLYACFALRPGCMVWATDVCVPISRLAECLLETKREIEESDLMAPIVGHAGDGNFHVGFLLEPGNEDELDRAKRVNDNMVARALAMGGTCTGEHGIGVGKIRYMEAEHGDSVDVMRLIKRSMDPQNLMNPGKVLAL
ncbi:MAG: FAD-binding protein [Proteobacteria bacterium]|nr:FAD-binding protein [Pseudomonadota bacterium]MDA1355408.1 FAD-binding protein [Pseudomonadota bacterium]